MFEGSAFFPSIAGLPRLKALCLSSLAITPTNPPTGAARFCWAGAPPPRANDSRGGWLMSPAPRNGSWGSLRAKAGRGPPGRGPLSPETEPGPTVKDGAIDARRLGLEPTVLNLIGGRFLLGKPCAAKMPSGTSSSSEASEGGEFEPLGPGVRFKGRLGVLIDMERLGREAAIPGCSPVTFIICCR